MVPFDECQCETGVCQETCPYGSIVALNGGIRDLLEISHTIQGQLETRVVGHTYFKKSGDAWKKTSEYRKLEKPFLETLSDAGCCGWINDYSDQLLLINGKNRKIIYDEWERFGNRNYDISFYVFNSELSPDFKQAAYTIAPDDFVVSEYKKTGKIRLNSAGKEDMREFARVTAAIESLPHVEVYDLNKKTGSTSIVKNAELAGWIDDKTLLLLKSGNLVKYDISTQQFTESPVKVKSIRNVFLR